ncbi:MAG: chorismate mutase [Spirochaetales bacterium]|nr:chorismate mutase [Spirochaetales bacterium]
MEAEERRVWAIRGAITVDSDTPADVDSAVKEMLDAIYKENEITEDDVVFTLFSQTNDITSRNAAAAARKSGYSTLTPLFCVQEAYVENMLPLTVRVMIEVEKKMEKKPVMVYLKGAAALRPDIRR